MRVAAYCRVSTDKEDQLNSLDAQKKFFSEYTEKNNFSLFKLYADEGISGTKIKNRIEFQKLMRDAEHNLFDMVLVKDISRFARNTVDFLQSIRKLKALNIETVFLTANQTVLGNSEFVLTVFGALAQEESANTSKRVKFGKKINAEKGRVPNFVYGYDKIPNNYFNLKINEDEASNIRRIFDLYTKEGMGTGAIANLFNELGIKTKRGYTWDQNGIKRILINQIYIGKVINGKEEVTDFLTSKRQKKDESDWYVVERPELRIISDEQFEQAKQIIESRFDVFHNSHERHSNKHLFSTLIKCRECGYSFRQKKYKGRNRWVCSIRDSRGVNCCENSVIIEEQVLIDNLQKYFSNVIINKEAMMKNIIAEFQRLYNQKNDNKKTSTELKQKQISIEKKRQKIMDMYVDELISRDELNQKLKVINSELEQLKKDITVADYDLNRGDMLGDILDKTFITIEDITDVNSMTNAELKKLIKKIEVDKDGHVDIFLNLIGEIGLDKDFLITDNHT